MSLGGRACLRPLLATALALSFSPPAPGQPAAPVSADAARSATIEWVKRSVVHIKSELAPADPLGISLAPSGRKARKTDEALRRLRERVDPGPRRQEGSGFVVDGERGLILTAAQIVGGDSAITLVLPDGSERPAERVAVDVERGIALLRAGALGLPGLRLAARPAKTGETTLVVGWMIPMGTILATEGMVMGTAAAGSFKSASAPPLVDYVVLDNVLPNGGFGGSPVVDRSGDVVGLVSAIYGRTYGRDALTMMIPASALKSGVEALIAGEKASPAP